MSRPFPTRPLMASTLEPRDPQISCCPKGRLSNCRDSVARREDLRVATNPSRGTVTEIAPLRQALGVAGGEVNPV